MVVREKSRIFQKFIKKNFQKNTSFHQKIPNPIKKKLFCLFKSFYYTTALKLYELLLLSRKQSQK